MSVLPGSGACMWCALECGRDIEREKGKEKKERVHVQISKKDEEGRKEGASEGEGVESKGNNGNSEDKPLYRI